MICPMMFSINQDSNVELHSLACFKEKCEWWDHSYKGCAISLIAANLSGLSKEGWIEHNRIQNFLEDKKGE